MADGMLTQQDIGPCELWQGSVHQRSGYGRWKGNNAHRQVWIEANGPISPGLSVLHKCDVRLCVRLSHLFLGTQLENMQDMRRKGRQPCFVGTKNSQAKLHDDQVRGIRWRYAQGGISQRTLGRLFGVNVATICDIVNLKKWAHVCH